MSDLTALLRKKTGVTKKTGGRKNAKTSKYIKNENEMKIDSVNIEQEENIIIHLPIKVDNINKPTNNNFEYIPNIDIPTGYEDGNDIYQHISQKNNPYKNSELIGIGPPPIIGQCTYPFDKKVKEGLDDVIDDENNKDIEKNVLSNSLISHLNDLQDVDIKELKKQRDLDILGKNKITKSSVEKCLLEMDEANKNKSWPSTVHIHCWWCCHPFENPPCSIPYEYKNGTYHVYGIFCSPECAAAYNFNDVHSVSDMWERYSLLNMLYRRLYENKQYKIKLAPSRQTLKIFGGHLSIDEFRANFNNQTHDYRIIMPPMVSIIPVQELSAIDRGFSSKHDANIKNINNQKDMDIVSNDSMNQQTSGLRLKRSKPFVATKNTLEKCMNLKVHKDENENENEYDDERNYEEIYENA
jgi:hypothetical protein